MSYSLNWITEYLAVGPAPMSYDDLDTIKAHGVRAVVNLCAEFSDLHELEEGAGLEVYYLPIHDECAPDMGEMEKALVWFDEAMYLKKKVLVHCRHGIGRTGTFVSAYLLRRGMGLKVAEKTLKTTRALPSNYSQWKLLKKYGKQQGQPVNREPSINDTVAIDLNHFFLDYDRLLHDFRDKHPERDTSAAPVEQCCTRYFELELIEAVFVSNSINIQLSQEARQQAIQAALAIMEKFSLHLPAGDENEVRKRESLWSGETTVCPLLKNGKCQLGDEKPLYCHIPTVSEQQEYAKLISKLSKDVFFALTSSFPSEQKMTFAMHDVISGRFVQQYFQIMLKNIETHGR